MNDANKKNGKRLRAALKQVLHSNNDSISHLATRLGTSQSYLSQLLSGDKPISGVSDSLLRQIADYLGIPVIAVFMLADRLIAADFLAPSPGLPDKLNLAITTISQSTAAIESGVETEVLEMLPEPVKLLLVLLYQQAYGIELLNPAEPGWWFGAGHKK